VGILNSIFDKLLHHAAASAPAAGSTSSAQGASQPGQQPAQQQPAAGGQPTLQNVDIDKVLADLAAKKGGGGNYRESIVDLLKLLDLDSSLTARKELAKELNVHAGADGSAEQNIALHHAVMDKVAQNGGKVPDSMKH
jgi:hypothetical protein